MFSQILRTIQQLLISTHKARLPRTQSARQPSRCFPHSWFLMLRGGRPESPPRQLLLCHSDKIPNRERDLFHHRFQVIIVGRAEPSGSVCGGWSQWQQVAGTRPLVTPATPISSCFQGLSKHSHQSRRNYSKQRPVGDSSDSNCNTYQDLCILSACIHGSLV